MKEDNLGTIILSAGIGITMKDMESMKIHTISNPFAGFAALREMIRRVFMEEWLAPRAPRTPRCGNE